MFGHASRPSRIWSFKCKPPHINKPLVADQISLAHQYQHKLVELERARREASDAAIHAAFPDLSSLREAVDVATAEVEAAEAVAKHMRGLRWA